MDYQLYVYFERELPLFDKIEQKLKEQTGLSIKSEFFDNREKVDEVRELGFAVTEDDVSQFCRFDCNGFTSVVVKNEGNRLEVMAEGTPTYFLFESLLNVLEELGGNVDDYEISEWGAKKWSDIRWWEFIRK